MTSGEKDEVNGRVNFAFQSDPADDKTIKKRNSVGAVNGQGSVPHCEVVTGDRTNTDCGLFNWRPKFLQKVNSSKYALAVLCWFSSVQGFVVNGINNVNTTSFERRFYLTSTQVSLIHSSYDIAAGIFVLPIGYYGRMGHKPRWLAFAAVSMALGSFIMMLPHFVSPAYNLQQTSDTCPLSEFRDGTCNGTSISNYLYMFMAGQFLHGIGGTTLYTIGVTYLDENVEMHNGPIFISIFEAFAALGPAVGFLMGGVFLDIYVDADTVPSSQVTITTNDPRWVGAWWIGYLISCAGFITVTLMLFLFGYELPEAEVNRKTRVSQAHADGSQEQFSRAEFGLKLRDLPKCTWLLLKNPTFMLLTAAGVLGSLCSSGLATFLPKFIQTQFSVAASWAALLTGFVIIPAGVVGQLCGGVIPGKLRWGVRGIIRYMAVVMLLGTVVVPAFYIRCDPNIMAGITNQYLNRSEIVSNISLANTCNAGCNCTTNSREPVCDENKVEYFSACYAGCTSSISSPNGTKLYMNCSCSETADQQATYGKCPSNCPLLPLFLFLLFVVVFCVMVCIPAGVVCSIRCVPDKQGAYSLAVQWLFVRFLATIPGPILYGAIVDQACVIWQDRCSKDDGLCWQYNQQRLGINFTLLTLGVCAVVVVCYFLAQVCYKAPTNDADTDGDKKSAAHVGAVGVIAVVGQDNPAFVETADTQITKF